MVRKYWTSPSACFESSECIFAGPLGPIALTIIFTGVPLPYLSYCSYSMQSAPRCRARASPRSACIAAPFLGKDIRLNGARLFRRKALAELSLSGLPWARELLRSSVASTEIKGIQSYGGRAKYDDTGLGAPVVCGLDSCSPVGNGWVFSLESHTYWPRHDPGMATGRRPRDGLVPACNASSRELSRKPAALYRSSDCSSGYESVSPWLDALAIILLAARIAQSSLHIALKQTELVAGARFGCYAIQVVCMVIMGVWAAVVAS